jgi:hypothetical protein
MSGSNCEPIIGVVKPAIFIKRSKTRHGSPGAIAAKPCTSQIADDAGELGQRQCGRVHL